MSNTLEVVHVCDQVQNLNSTSGSRGEDVSSVVVGVNRGRKGGENGEQFQHIVLNDVSETSLPFLSYRH